MKFEIIAIGDEILRGNIINSNASFISEKLREKGYLVERHGVLSDNPEKLIAGIEEALLRSDLVITTGGLGPTLDDRTKNTIAKLFDVKLVHNAEIEKDLKKRFGFLPTLKEQATIFEGSHYFVNRVGTAPGMVLKKKGKTLVLLPGVPPELHEMFSDVLSWIEQAFPLKEHFYQEKVYLALLPEPLVDAYLRELAPMDPKVEIGIYPSTGFLQVHFSSKEKKRIQPLKDKLREKFASFYFEYPTIEEAVHEALIKQGKTLAFAESCSGGTMASRLTALPGVSKYFLGSIVSYSNEMKADILGVSEHTLTKYGAISKETVNEMVEGLFNNTTADFAVAVSGIAGPGGGTVNKPVGTVFIAVGQREGTIDSGVIQAQGPRNLVIAYTVNTALSALWRRIVHNERTFEL